MAKTASRNATKKGISQIKASVKELVVFLPLINKTKQKQGLKKHLLCNKRPNSCQKKIQRWCTFSTKNSFWSSRYVNLWNTRFCAGLSGWVPGFHHGKWSKIAPNCRFTRKKRHLF
jgi:hypothetical protein